MLALRMQTSSTRAPLLLICTRTERRTAVMQLLMNFTIALIWWIPGIVNGSIVAAASLCLEVATLRAELTLAYVGVVILNVVITTPYVPADGLPTREPIVDAFAWTDASRARKLNRQRADMATAVVHVPPSVRVLRPVFSIETAIKAFAWSCLLYDFEDVEDHRFVTLLEEVRICTEIR